MSIDLLFRALRPALRSTYRTPRRVLLFCLVLAALGTWSASHLRIDNDFSHLIPPDYPSVQALTELRDQFGAESDIAVLIQSPSFDANTAFAETLIPAALDLTYARAGSTTAYIKTADYRRDVSFMQDHALYFATDAELDSLEAYLRREARQARLEANPFYFELEDPDAEPEGDETLATLQSLYKEMVTSEYQMSADSTRLLVRLLPTGAQTDLAFIRDVYRALHRLVERLEPERFHPAMQVELGGRLKRQMIEVDAILNDITGSFGAGVLTLLALVVAYFAYRRTRLIGGTGAAPSPQGPAFKRQLFWKELRQAPWAAVVLGLPLLVSLAWTYGLVHFVYDQLNLMTSALGLILFGLGIDFGIHFYARYLEEREAGHGLEDALERTFQTTGQAIAIVGFTTAGGFFILMLADFRGFSQFGFTASTGTLFALAAMLGMLPALIAGLDHWGWLRHDVRHASHPDGQDLQPGFSTQTGSEDYNDIRAGTGSAEPIRTSRFRQRLHIPASLAERLFQYLPHPKHVTVHRAVVRGIVGVTVVAILAAMTQLSGVQFEYDFGELEPRYEAYEAFKDKTRDLHSTASTRNAAYVLTDSPADAEAVAHVLRRRAEQDTTSPTIRAVETIYDRFPVTREAQQAKLDRLQEIRNLLDDRFLRASENEDLQRLEQAASARAPIPLDDVPDFIKAPFLKRDGTVGDIVIVYPSVGLADGRKSMAFADDVSRITLDDGTTYYSASTSIVASDMLRLMIDEAPLMILLTVSLILVFKAIALGRLRWIALAFAPLAVSFLWMFGAMSVLGLKLNFFNLVVLPTVLGIGDDSSIHLVHRYREEGRGSVRKVITSTGEHVTMSAITTMIGFGGLLLSMHPGLRSIGALAVLGIAMTLVAAMISLPALLQWLEWRSTPPADEQRQKEREDGNQERTGRDGSALEDQPGVSTRA